MNQRLFATGCGIGVLLGAAVLFGHTHPRPPAPPSIGTTDGLAASRVPAVAPGPFDMGPDQCQSLYKLICTKRGVTRDPTGSVRPDVDGEVLALRKYSEIIRQHPDWESDQVDEELAAEIYTPKVRARIESAFKWVLLSIQRFIDEQSDHVFSAEEKRALKARVGSVELQLPPPATAYADEPDLLTKNDVFYERLGDGRMRLRVGGAYFFTAKSWFNIIFTMGHELAHSIDPCEIKGMGLPLVAYTRLSSCFMDKGLIAKRANRLECGANDQLSETFADWVASQVSAEAMKTFSHDYPGAALIGAVTNSVRDLCEPDAGLDDEVDTEFHPSPKTRIDGIFGHNAKIRSLMGCSPPPEKDVCSFDPKPSGTRPL